MKNASFFVLLVIFFVSFSCSDDKPPTLTPSTQTYTYEQFKQKMMQAALKSWEDFQEKHPERKGINTNRGPGETAPCNCSYRITALSWETPDGLPNVEVEFTSLAQCEPGNPFECNFFTGYGFTGDICGSCYLPGCCDLWEEIPPTDIFPFNCQVKAYSIFPVRFGVGAYDICTIFGDALDWSVTFRIYCQESEPNPSCGPGGGYGFVSDPITLSYSPENPNYDETYIELKGCGCEPFEVE